MHIPGPDNTQAAEHITESYNRAMNRSFDQAMFMLGDFTVHVITGLLPNLPQNVTCLTQFNKTIDLCFSNISDAFQSLCRPPLGHSSHKVIHLIPKGRQKLKHEKPRTHALDVLDHDSSEAFRGCFECTVWQVFFDGCSDNLD